MYKTNRTIIRLWKKKLRIKICIKLNHLERLSNFEALHITIQSYLIQYEINRIVCFKRISIFAILVQY